MLIAEVLPNLTALEWAIVGGFLIASVIIVMVAGVKKSTPRLIAATILAASLILTPLVGPSSPTEVTAWATLVLAVTAAGTMLANVAVVRAMRETADIALDQLRLSYPVVHIIHIRAFSPGQETMRGEIKMVDGSQVARHVEVWAKSYSQYYRTKDPLAVIPGSTVPFRLVHSDTQSPYPAINEKPAEEIWLALSWITPDNYLRSLGWQVVDRKLEAPIELSVK